MDNFTNKNQKVLILGIDGYLGWPLSIYLKERGYQVFGLDNFLRRKMVAEVKGHSAIPILEPKERMKYIPFEVGDLLDYSLIKNLLRRIKPDAIIHFAEQPSAPYSMIDAKHAAFTQENNVIGTLNLLWTIKEECPETNLIKLGTLGEYGTPNIDIPEGFFEIEYHGRKDTLPFPKQAGSWYHLTKVHDSNNIMFACKIWKIRSTDLNQGPVYGTRIDEIKEDWQRTRYDFDHVFGTVINRYAAQAVIGYPLTPYGQGGQTRGFININDTMQAIELCIKNPPALGEYRVFNQFYELFTVYQLATLIKEIGNQYGLDVTIKPIENPRVEAEKHYYNPSNENLFKLGWKPRGIRQILPQSIEDLIKFKDRIEVKRDFIRPTIRWR